MAKWTSVEILQRLIDRFKLQLYPIDPNKALILLEQICPVTSIDALLSKPKVDIQTSASFDTTGNKVIYTVPAGKRHTVLSFWVTRNSGDATYTGFYFYDPHEAAEFSYNSISATYYFRSGMLATPPVFDETWQIRANVDAVTSASVLQCGCLVIEEDAY